MLFDKRRSILMLLTKAACWLAGRLRMRSGRVTSSCQRIGVFNVRVVCEREFLERNTQKLERRYDRNGNSNIAYGSCW